jgi:5-methylcytosine-specific restriction endonuclease McrA
MNCTKCGTELTAKTQMRDRSRPSGLHPWCKACKKAHSAPIDHASYYRANRKQVLAQKQDYYAKNRETILVRKNAYYLTHKEQAATAARAWEARNLERKRELSREWGRANPEKKRAANARYLKKHPEAKTRMAVNTREWVRANAEKMREYFRSAAATRRAHKKAVKCTLTRTAWHEILEVFDHRCAYCLRPCVELQQEHVWPLSRGGEHTEENVVPACQPCNSKKSARGPLHTLRF